MSSAAAARPIRRASSKRSSIRYDLRRRVLVSNLNRAVSPLHFDLSQKAEKPLTEVQSVLPSKPQTTAPLDLLRDIPSDRKKAQPVVFPQGTASTQQQTPEKKIFRVDPSILSRNPILHSPTKAPAKRRLSEPNRPTISLHLLREHYRPPTKKDCPKNSVIFNPSAVSETKSTSSTEEFQYDSPPARPVPLPRKSKMPISSTAIPTSMSKRPQSSNSNDSEDSEDPIYAKIENCRTGSKEDLAKYGYTGSNMTLRQKPPNESTANHVRFLDECSERKRRNSLPINSGILRLRPRFSSTSGECRAKKSLLFSDSIESTKTSSGLTVKNIHADREGTSLADLISGAQTSPEAASPPSAPRILNQSGIYSNNTLVVESKKLKKDEVDKSYGFACRMRPMLRVFNSGTPPQVLPNKESRRKLELDQSPLKAPAPINVTATPPRPPPRISPSKSSNENTPAKTTPCKEIAVQTSFVVHGAVDCPQSKGSAKKRRRSMEIIAEVGAKVRRRSSILKDKLYRSLDITPSK